jgi:hypothetical protein
MQDLDLQAVSQRMNLIATELQEEVRQSKIFCGAIAQRRGNCGVFSIDANDSVINT